jgi:hypothetical protein
MLSLNNKVLGLQALSTALGVGGLYQKMFHPQPMFGNVIMRTLNRPMFNMGGPIKQGIMHGIREPYKHGGPTGTGLVGDPKIS